MTADSAMSYPSYVNPQVLTMFNVSTLLNQKDSRWLQLEVCRESQRQKCTRSDAECKFAHPPPNVEVQNGRVTACYDSIKGRCNREKPACKYFHPPQHLKDQLLINGRNHLALKNALAQQMQQQIIPGQMPAATMVSQKRKKQDCAKNSTKSAKNLTKNTKIMLKIAKLSQNSKIIPSTALRMHQCRSPTRPTYRASSRRSSRGTTRLPRLFSSSPHLPSRHTSHPSRYSSNRPNNAMTASRRSQLLVWCLTREPPQQTSPVCPSTSPFSSNSSNSSNNSSSSSSNSSSSNSSNKPYKQATTNCYSCSNSPTWCQLHMQVPSPWPCPGTSDTVHADRDPATTLNGSRPRRTFGPQRPGLNTSRWWYFRRCSRGHNVDDLNFHSTCFSPHLDVRIA